MSQKFVQFKKLNKIERKKNYLLQRDNHLRLDKNEMISQFSSNFIKLIKKKINSNTLTTYPEVDKIYKLISKKYKIKENSIIVTAGSDLAIKNCFELLVRKNDHIITLSPTYGMVNVYSKLFEARQTKIGFDKNLNLEVDKLLNAIKKSTVLIIIANPNSPTGKAIHEKQIIKILNLAKKNNTFVLIDECYFDYSKFSSVGLINKYNNLIISRSFSKSGLAGCRIGYLVSNVKIASLLYKYRPFYEISSFSVKTLELFLRYNLNVAYRKEVEKGRKVLESYLIKKGINYFNSTTNFILIKLNSSKTINSLSKFLVKKKILCTVEKNIPHHKQIIRFSLGPVKEMKILIKKLELFFTSKKAYF